SAGWLLRVVTEELLGLKMRGGKLLPDPKLPPEWSGFTAEIHGIKLECRGGSVLVNSQPWDGKGITLKNCTDLRNVHSQTERSML
ncbi:MAG: hypothetical protein LUC20_07700, partial [Oscillospiraceae bacterium]|nr:hypothetical protein [Oscillospiraceae bacterium]